MVDVVFGAGMLDRVVRDSEVLLLAYRADSGLLYLDHKPRTPVDELVVEDLAITMLVNSRFGLDAARSVIEHGHELGLAALPSGPLEETDDNDRMHVAETIAQMIGWRGSGASIASKVLHKKRPALIHRTPTEVRKTWEDGQREPRNSAA